MDPAQSRGPDAHCTKAGRRTFGEYTLARWSATLRLITPPTSGVSLCPTASAAYGRTGSAQSLRTHLWASVGITAALVIPACVLRWAAIASATRRRFHTYVPGIETARVAFIGGLAWSHQATTLILDVVRRHGPLRMAIAVTLRFMWGWGIWMIRRGVGIEEVARLRAVCMFLLGRYTFSLSRSITRSRACNLLQRQFAELL